MALKFEVPTLARMASGTAIGFAFVASVKALLTGDFEVRSLLVPMGWFVAMYWTAMSTLAEQGWINRFLTRHGLIRKPRR